MFRALRQLGIAALILAHVSKEDAKKPFGSAFWWNLSRSVWRLSHEQDPDSNHMDVGLEHRKANAFKLQAPMAIRVSHGDGTIKFTKTSVMGMAKLASGLPVTYQVDRLLQDGNRRTVKEIADELNDGITGNLVSQDSISKALRRGAEFKQITESDMAGKGRKVWAIDLT
jgi:hypothetical protein